MQNLLAELSVTAAVAEEFVRRFDAKSKEKAQKLHILLFGKKAETEVIPEDPTLERIGSRARRYKTALRIILFISRSALQMDLVLTVLYYRKIMLHWSEAWPR
uniref:Uncharacterized protein n=1 Tax=Candidatus Kentrum sp. SD TaxID=2126332 RepID=A0A451BL81_9GAMM|nr:MAG: hypothetical protein BECKSD772D_GA0070982_103316 [Candidatus Kentron sp. SD]